MDFQNVRQPAPITKLQEIYTPRLDVDTVYDEHVDFADRVDDTVILYGIADNAMAGAVLRCGPTSHVYIDGLARWSDSERYAAFEVTGTLVEEGSDLDLRADDDAVVHGIGKHYAVKNATWKPLSP